MSAEERYVARSASHRTDDWPFWYVADREKGNLNVTVELCPELRGFMPFLPREAARWLAAAANNRPLADSGAP